VLSQHTLQRQLQLLDEVLVLLDLHLLFIDELFVYVDLVNELDELLLSDNISSSNEKTGLLYARVQTRHAASLYARVIIVYCGKGSFLHPHRRLVLVLFVIKVRLNLGLIIVGGGTSGGSVRREGRIFPFLEVNLMLWALWDGSGRYSNLDLLLRTLTPPCLLLGRCLGDILLVTSLSRLLLFTVRVCDVFALRVLLMLALT